MDAIPHQPPPPPSVPAATRPAPGGQAPPTPRTVIARAPAAVTTLGLLLAYPRPGAEPKIYPLSAGRVAIGRDPSQPVHLPDSRVSSLHAYFFLREDTSSYADMSTNGSLVDGQVVHGTSIPIEPGAKIQVGGTLLVFLRLPAAPDASAWCD